MSPGERAVAWELERNGRQIFWLARGSFVLVGSLPWWLPLARAHLPLGPVGTFLDAWFILVCHRLPERTLEFAGVAMPICSRCGGIFLGLAIGAALAWPRIGIRQARWALLVAGLLMLADVVTQDMGVHPPWHSSRIATGALLGWVASSALMAAIIRERRLDRPETAPPG
jgi:uncharacterized membrane protein